MMWRFGVLMLPLLTACGSEADTRDVNKQLGVAGDPGYGGEWSNTGGSYYPAAGAPSTGGYAWNTGTGGSAGGAVPPTGGGANGSGGSETGGTGQAGAETGGYGTGGYGTGGYATGGSAGSTGGLWGTAGSGGIPAGTGGAPCGFPFPCVGGAAGMAGAAGAGGGLMTNFKPDPTNPKECPAAAPENPWGPCAGLPIYVNCKYSDGTRVYACVCDWIHWICI